MSPVKVRVQKSPYTKLNPHHYQENTADRERGRRRGKNYNRAMKGNGFDTGVIAVFKEHSLWSQPGIEPIPLHCSVLDQSMTIFPVFQGQF